MFITKRKTQNFYIPPPPPTDLAFSAIEVTFNFISDLGFFQLDIECKPVHTAFLLY